MALEKPAYHVERCRTRAEAKVMAELLRSVFADIAPKVTIHRPWEAGDHYLVVVN